MTTQPDTIVLVHGFWVTPRSWEHWVTHYEAKGYRVLRPGYPGSRSRSRRSRANPDIIVATVPGSSRSSTRPSTSWTAKPIIIGHSAGGAFTADPARPRLGAAGVA